MKNYIGTKAIQAEPCKGFNNKCWEGGEPVRKSIVLVDGYKVVYPDGNTAWLAKEVFETVYKEAEKTEVASKNKKTKDSKQSEEK